MNTTRKLYQTTKIVQGILEKDVEARNSDNYLYYKVLSVVGRMNDIDINSMSIPTFLLNINEFGFPAFETVRRTRQKIQAEIPELRGNKTVEHMREMNEEEYRKYAKERLA